MDALTPCQRTTALLKCGEDLSHDEVAARLDVSVQTTKKHVAAILQRLGVNSMHGACWRLAYEEGYDHAVRTLPLMTPALRPEQV